MNPAIRAQVIAAAKRDLCAIQASPRPTIKDVFLKKISANQSAATAPAILMNPATHAKLTADASKERHAQERVLIQLIGDAILQYAETEYANKARAAIHAYMTADAMRERSAMPVPSLLMTKDVYLVWTHAGTVSARKGSTAITAMQTAPAQL